MKFKYFRIRVDLQIKSFNLQMKKYQLSHDVWQDKYLSKQTIFLNRLCKKEYFLINKK